ncbi:MAG TPA: ABC transporter permease [Candidatus Binatia bacterium]|nr:ABC transporter permease [Candidatus Binatia bacterium]
MTPDEPFIRWDWIVTNLDDIGERTAEHVLMTVIAVSVGFVLSFALSLLIVRWRRLYAPIIGASGVLYAIPSLGLFALLIPITGFTLLTAEIALVSYTLLILVRNIVAGFDGVPSDVLEAATGMGYGPWQLLWRVQLPLALPTIVAGLRIATVTTVGLVAVTALIGQSNLGSLIVQRGIRASFPTAILVGAVGSVALGLLADLGFIGLQRLLTPWARDRSR